MKTKSSSSWSEQFIFSILWVWLCSGMFFAGYCTAEVKKVYWTDWSNGCVWSANGDGTGSRKIYNVTMNSLDGLDFDSVTNKLYIGTSYDLLTCNPDGSSAQTIYQGESLYSVYSVAVDEVNRKVFWSSWGKDGAKRIYRSNLDGSSVQTIYTSSNSNEIPYNIDFYYNLNMVYWAQTNDIYRANMDGSNRQLVWSDTLGIGHLSGLALDVAHDKLYFSSWEGGGIWRADLDGDNPEKISSEKTSQLRVDSESGKLYWISWTNSPTGIRYSNLDGSSPQTLCQTPGFGNSFVLEIVPEPASLLLLGLGGLLIRKRQDGRTCECVNPDPDVRSGQVPGQAGERGKAEVKGKMAKREREESAPSMNSGQA